MHPLKEALARLHKGWSAQVPISQRRTMMVAHAGQGDALRAERYAAEIEALQLEHAEITAGVARMHPADSAPQGREVWRLRHLFWGELLVRGYLTGRHFYPLAGATIEDARAEACRAFHCPVAPMGIEPVYRIERVAA